jgi:hypothetical protein
MGKIDMTIPRVSLAILMFGAIQLHAQGPTLSELARQGGGVVGGIGSGWPGTPFKLIAGRADLVIEGTVMNHRTYPTPDERDIFTDFELSVSQVIFQRTPQVSERPSPPAPFVFKTQGGTVVFDGVPITVDVEGNGKRVTLKDGDHIVIFGHYDSADGKWEFSPWDVFYTSGGMVKNDLPVFEGLDEGLTPIMSIGVFGAKVREVADQR